MFTIFIITVLFPLLRPQLCKSLITKTKLEEHRRLLLFFSLG